MSARVRCAIVVGPLAGDPLVVVAVVPRLVGAFQSWRDPRGTAAPRSAASGWNGSTPLAAVRLVPDRLAARQRRPGAGRRSRARRAACRSSGRTSGSPASGRRCARRPRGCRVRRLAGIVAALAMLSDSIVAAMSPPASWRNLRRLTSCMSITKPGLPRAAPLRSPDLRRSAPEGDRPTGGILRRRRAPSTSLTTCQW